MKVPSFSQIAAPALFAVMVLSICQHAKAEFVFGDPQDLELGQGAMVSTSADGLTLYFSSDRPGHGNEDLWVSRRTSTDDVWGSPVNLQQINSAYREAFPCLSPDGLTLFFSDYFYGPDRPGGLGGHDIWMSKRTSPDGPWGVPENMGAPFNSSAMDLSPTISRDGLTFIFASSRGRSDYDLWQCVRSHVQEPWGPPVNLGPLVNSGSHDYYGNLSPDGLVLFFESNRSGSYAGWMTRRNSVDDPWAPPVPLPNPIGSKGVGCFSASGSSYYAGLSLVPIVPIMDFSGNGRIDTKDLLKLIEAWDQENPVLDIGPAPLGDGVVNAADLEALMEHWGQEVDDPTLKACWKLEETEGSIAYDSAGINDAVVIGDAVWQSEEGRVERALLLNGVDNYANAPFILNPGKTVFSVYAWVKGGAPNQVILSQGDGADWLSADSEGCLMTTLESGGRRSGGPLISEAVITDGYWHRVGLTWDGVDRVLYMDDVKVAHDT